MLEVLAFAVVVGSSILHISQAAIAESVCIECKVDILNLRIQTGMSGMLQPDKHKEQYT